jgi:hypothetical protein
MFTAEMAASSRCIQSTRLFCLKANSSFTARGKQLRIGILHSVCTFNLVCVNSSDTGSDYQIEGLKVGDTVRPSVMTARAHGASSKCGGRRLVDGPRIDAWAILEASTAC